MIKWTTKGKIEVRKGGVLISSHIVDREAWESVAKHSALHGAGKYVVSYPNVEVDVVPITVVSTDTEAPTQPGSFAVTAPVTGGLLVSWSASTDGPAGASGGSGLRGYRVWRATNGAGPFTQIALVEKDTLPLQYLDLSLGEAQTRHYFVDAIDNAQNVSSPTATASATTSDLTAPTQPVISATAIGSSEIQVALTTPSVDTGSGVVSYSVEYRDFSTAIYTTAYPAALPGQFPVLISGLAPSTNYSLRVRAVDGAGNFSAYGTGLATTGIGGGLTLVHGALATITGSGFIATKPLGQQATLAYDNCTGSNPLAIWDEVFPYNQTIRPTANGAYRTTPFTRSIGSSPPTISHPHSRGSKIYAGCYDEPDLYFYFNIGVRKGFNKPAGNFLSYIRFWEQADLQWQNALSDGDNNYKIYDWSYGDLYGGGQGDRNWYLAYNVEGAPNANWPQVMTHNDDGYGGNPQNIVLSPQGLYGSSAAANPRGNWVLRELWVDHTASGHYRYLENDSDTPTLSYDGNTADNYTGGGTYRSHVLGTYRRAGPASTQWNYYADMMVDVIDPSGGIFFLTNNASWAASTIREAQQETAHSNTSCTILVNGGRLSNGTVHVHFRKAPWGTGHQYLGTGFLSG